MLISRSVEYLAKNCLSIKFLKPAHLAQMANKLDKRFIFIVNSFALLETILFRKVTSISSWAMGSKKAPCAYFKSIVLSENVYQGQHKIIWLNMNHLKVKGYAYEKSKWSVSLQSGKLYTFI